VVACPLVLGARSLAQGAKATVLAWMSIAPPPKPVAAAAKTPVACAMPSCEVCALIGGAANPPVRLRDSAFGVREAKAFSCEVSSNGEVGRLERLA